MADWQAVVLLALMPLALLAGWRLVVSQRRLDQATFELDREHFLRLNRMVRKMQEMNREEEAKSG